MEPSQGVVEVTPTSDLALLPNLPPCEQLWPRVPTIMPSLLAGSSDTEYLSLKLVLTGALVTVT